MTQLREHTGVGFSINVPMGWVEQTVDVPGVQLVVVEPDEPNPASIVVTAERPEGVASFADWQEKAEGLLEEQLGGYRLLDFIRVPVGEHDGVRRAASHASDGVPMTMLQYITAPGQTGWTVTLSAPDWRFPQTRSVLEQVGMSFRCEASA